MKGSSNNAAKEANAAEEARQAAIKNTQGRINQVFNDPSRAADIADTVGAAQTFYQRDLDEQKGNSDRDLKFALARNGVIGGSTQNDQQEVLGKQYAKGTLAVQQKALGVGSQLETGDQDARARLISLATSGLDSTTAAQQAAAAMRSNLDATKATALTQSVGDFFGQTKSFADQARDAAQRRRANQDAGWNLYSPSAVSGAGYGGG
jgi:hypothetical protein